MNRCGYNIVDIVEIIDLNSMEIDMKIALAGSAGTGRTTIAIRVAEAIGHVPLTNLAKTILKEEGFRYGTDQTVEEFLATNYRQRRLFQFKQENEAKHSDFVTDRSWIDLAAYCIQGMQSQIDFDMASFIEDCRAEVEKYDVIIHIPWGRQPLQSNGTRTINPWFQFIIDSIIYRMANQWKLEMIEVPVECGNPDAIKWVLESIQLLDPSIIIKPTEEENDPNSEET